MLVFGGVMANGSVSNALYMYDTVTSVWSTLSPNLNISSLPMPRAGSAVACSGSKFVVVGGITSPNYTVTLAYPLGDVWYVQSWPSLPFFLVLLLPLFTRGPVGFFSSLPRYFDLIQMAWTLLETEILASVNQGPARFGAGLSIINQTAILFAGLGQVFF